jgi:hypothetical protein
LASLYGSVKFSTVIYFKHVASQAKKTIWDDFSSVGITTTTAAATTTTTTTTTTKHTHKHTHTKGRDVRKRRKSGQTTLFQGFAKM